MAPLPSPPLPPHDQLGAGAEGGETVTMVALGASEGQRGLEPVEPSAKAGGPVSCRTGCCCRGYAWIAPGMRNLQFCVYW